MTMLYRLDAAAREIGRALAVDEREDPWNGGHVAPGGFAPIVTAGREFVAGPRSDVRAPRRLVPCLWGVPPPPSALEARPVLSARNTESPFWVGNLRNAEFRCLVPATAFMEWGKGIDLDGKRIRHWFSCADQPIFAFAGVWKDSEVPSFALLTCEPNAVLLAAGRDAMPVILPAARAAQDLWLRGGWDRASALLVPYASSLMVAA